MPRKLILFSLGPAVALVGTASAQITIDPAHKYAWGENIGWTNWADAGNNGSRAVKIHATFLEGFIWAENVGWVNVGDGTPANGVRYANVNGSDSGVNRAGNDRLSGFAWAENVGWINFGGGALATPARPARVDIAADRLRGYVWGENVGWINLDDPNHYIGLGSACYADCDTTTGVGVLDIFDFLCFQNLYDAMDPYACDCDTSTGVGVCDIFDFLCFQNAFASGCS